MLRWRRDDSQPLPSARIGHIAVAVDARAVWGEELVVVHGGIGEAKQALRDVAVLEVGGRHWLSPAPASGTGPASRAFHCATAVGRSLFLFGGHVYVKEKRGLQKFNDMWALDTDTWEWSQQITPQGLPTPGARDFAALTTLPGERVLLFGGLDASERRLDDAWVFYPRSHTWTEIKTTGAKPKPRYGHGLVLLSPPPAAARPAPDLLTGSLGDMTAQSDSNAVAASATIAEARVLLFGGETAAGAVNDLWVLRGAGSGADAKEGTWIAVSAAGIAPTARKGHAVAGTQRGVVVACGHTATVGWLRSRTDVYHGDAYLLQVTPGSGLQWVVAAAGPTEADDVMPLELAELHTPAPREFHSLTALSDGRVLMLGGGNGKEMFGDAWWLDFGHNRQSNSKVSAQHMQQPQLAAVVPQDPFPLITPSDAGDGSQPLPPPKPAAPIPGAVAAASLWWRGTTQATPPLPLPGGLSRTFSGIPSSPAALDTSNLGTLRLSELSVPSLPTDVPLDGMDSATAAAVVIAAAAAEVEDFRERLGLPGKPPSAAVPPAALPVEADEILLACGRGALALQGSSQGMTLPPYAIQSNESLAATIDAARSAFTQSGEGQSLRLQDLPALLSDYKRLSHGRATLPLPNTQKDQERGSGRYLHLDAADMRLGDLPQLLHEYRDLVVLP